MTCEALGFIAREMETLNLKYEFMQFTGVVAHPYFVGEYTEVEPMNEDGYEETNFILTGTTKGTYFELERCKQKIKENFNPISGKTFVADSGATAVVFYCNSFPIPTGNAELKRLQINLKIKEWKVKE